ncbi:autotransporter-associated beta strand repeat-containing protein [Oceanobacter mangrovi]|uniref:autotransporter-associated beta strand repeat-containing protein n=1 Tax=Oceanobacter mangrovi TaxID=2862510 RepID=UPI001C8D8BEB|nr:autotransporter-associated beta strand repeat-containing protein [Oceanobacter mangrovi]
MTTATSRNKQGLLYTAMMAATAMMLTACGSDDNHHSTSVETTTDTAISVAKPTVPAGLGREGYAAVPSVDYPFPVIENADNNADSSLRYILSQNAVAYALRGMNSIWQGTSDEYQEAASGNGPDSYIDSPIVNATAWQENIQYVIDVTNNRTDDEAILAFLDDRRSKNYSVIDGFGPLTEAYVEASGAYVELDGITKAEVLEDEHYAPDDNDNSKYMGAATAYVESGDSAEVMPLTKVADLVYRFRQASPASTSPSKYIYASPRPWRMDDTGAVDFQGTTGYSYSCIDEEGNESLNSYDTYTSSVSVIPGLMCARRAHSSSDESKGLYSADGDGRRKDGGYPSGHTNAATLASLAYAYALPERFAEMVARGAQLGENRIVAGMHSPADVIGGRIHALTVAAYALNNDDGATVADEAQQTAQSYFGELAAAAGMSLYDYAHQTVASEAGYSYTENGTEYVNVEVFNNNIYDDFDAIQQTYRFRLTYGMSQDTDAAGADPIVPEGAEALLKSRLPYLSAEQRRVVMASTEIDSGYPLLDDSNGWGRLDLVSASAGYGAFDADVSVYMEAGKGGFNAKDWWRNDISGAGKLTKSGSGTLVLTGDNSYSGGTVIEAGVLSAASDAAFGSGTVYVSGGDMQIDADGAVAVSDLLIDAAGTLAVEMDDDSNQLAVSGTAYVEGAALELSFDSAPTAGTEYTILTADEIGGEFGSVYAGDVEVSLSYTATSVIATVE